MNRGPPELLGPQVGSQKIRQENNRLTSEKLTTTKCVNFVILTFAVKDCSIHEIDMTLFSLCRLFHPESQ